MQRPIYLFKPDLVAPGNIVGSLLAPGSYFERQFPERVVDQDYMTLSGSSMAAAFVSGTVAQMLEANADLSPSTAKQILITTAAKLAEPSMLEQGNGMVNTKTAVELAEAIDTPSLRLMWEAEKG